MNDGGAVGPLYVFEGPDGVGKSAVASSVASSLQAEGLPCRQYAFPGNTPGTLGHLVYRLHHEPKSLNVCLDNELSRQLLHIAAHVEAIDERIEPALRSGAIVVLDRYWWSTWVYGLTGGVPERLLSTALSVERDCWGSITPSILFCFTDGPGPTHRDHDDKVNTYRSLAQRERSDHRIKMMPNHPPLQSTVDSVLDYIYTDLNGRLR